VCVRERENSRVLERERERVKEEHTMSEGEGHARTISLTKSGWRYLVLFALIFLLENRCVFLTSPLTTMS
jgi:hypothetical protein